MRNALDQQRDQRGGKYKLKNVDPRKISELCDQDAGGDHKKDHAPENISFFHLFNLFSSNLCFNCL